MSVFGVILVRIFLHLNWIRTDTPIAPYSDRMWENTSITPNTDTFHALKGVTNFKWLTFWTVVFQTVFGSLLLIMALLIVSPDFVQKTERQRNKQTFIFIVMVQIIVAKYKSTSSISKLHGTGEKFEIVNVWDSKKNPEQGVKLIQSLVHWETRGK